MDDIDLPFRTVTCHTAGCENENIPITFPCLETVVCGCCGQLITDIEGQQP